MQNLDTRKRFPLNHTIVVANSRVGYASRAEIALGAKSNPLLINVSNSTCCLLFLAVLALGFKLRVLLLVQDGFRFLHVFCLARLVAAIFLMLRHQRIHLCLLLRCQVEAGQRNGTSHFSSLVSRLLRALTMLARKHCARHEEPRRY